jgi:hypothetical protein
MQNDRIRSLCCRFAAISLLLSAATAFAQAAPPALDLRLHDLQQPSDDEDAASSDFGAGDTTTHVHGSFTTGIGYSKNFGNSTYNAAELDVSKQTDSGRAVDLHIAVQRTTGLPYASPPDYVRRYP